ncbi:MFS transporter [Pseudoclavibacter sp. CFCC 14310]|uniref:MFS transporter n=1 Tax=Pseudoclavibacter sp. CFCC 14310 TaxID=2615180 RepID=UPI001301571B|nr:MFS transporter [Pseudoclavibacter sp. CFCC 14310]KAB1644584.1 MFS transporter [Pseudoclavibacter sp. CFCC 14310]
MPAKSRPDATDALFHRIVFALFAAGFATFAQLYSVQSVLPEISADFGVDPSQAALTISMATTGIAIGVLPWAFAADRWGRVRVMKVSAVSAAVIGLVTPFLHSLPLILGSRLIEGLALAAIPAIAVTYIADELPARRVTAAAGAFVSGNSIGGLLGRLIAGLVSEHFGWQLGLMTVAVLCVVACSIFVIAVPAPHGYLPSRLRTEDVTAAAAAQTRQERTVASPVPSLSAWQRFTMALTTPALWGTYAQPFLLMGSFLSLFSFLGYHLQAAPYGLSTAVTSMVFTVYLVGTFTARWSGSVAGRFGHRRLLYTGIGMMIGGAALTLTAPLAVIVLGVALFTAGYFVTSPVTSAMTSLIAGPCRSQATAIYQLVFYVGNSVFGWMLGRVFEEFDWAGVALGIITMCLVAALIAATLLPKRPGAAASRSPASS